MERQRNDDLAFTISGGLCTFCLFGVLFDRTTIDYDIWPKLLCGATNERNAAMRCTG